MQNIVIVDDEKGILNALIRLLRRAPCVYADKIFSLQIEAYATPAEAIEYIANHKVDLVMSDYHMPTMDGVSFLTKAKELQPDVATILMSGYGDLNMVMDALNRVGVSRFMAKPWVDYEMVTAIAQTLATHEVMLENKALAEYARDSLKKENVNSNNSVELLELELAEPGITQMRWSESGEVILDDETHG